MKCTYYIAIVKHCLFCEENSDMEKTNTDNLISKLITGTYEDFYKNIVEFLKIVSIQQDTGFGDVLLEELLLFIIY